MLTIIVKLDTLVLLHISKAMPGNMVTPVFFAALLVLVMITFTAVIKFSGKVVLNSIFENAFIYLYLDCCPA